MNMEKRLGFNIEVYVVNEIRSPGDDMDMPDIPSLSSSSSEKKRAAEDELVMQPEPMEVADEEREVKQRKVEAQKEKEAGKAAHKKKDFETAIQHYSKAIESDDDDDNSFITNRVAVYLEMGKFLGLKWMWTMKLFSVWLDAMIMEKLYYLKSYAPI